MRMLILPFAAIATVLCIGTATAAVPDGCDDEFRELDQELTAAVMKSEDEHSERSALLAAFQRCRAGDTDAFEEMM
jgi:hypothetical protein